MIRVALLAALLAITGCRATLADMQGFTRCEDVPQVDFREVAHNHLRGVQEICGPRVAGCAIYTGLTRSDSCTIHYERGDQYTRRHECHHCKKGAFHP